MSARQSIVLVSDLDHTMVQNEDLHHWRLLAFNHCWSSLVTPDESPSLLVFSTGRSPYLFKTLWNEAPLLTPDVLICSVGSEIFYNTQSEAAKLLGLSEMAAVQDDVLVQRYVPDPEWQSVLDQAWSRAKIQQLIKDMFPELVVQVDSEQRPHKLSYNLPPKDSANEQIVDRLRQTLSQEGFAAKVIYSGGADVDILSAHAGKGCGLAFVLKRLKEAGYPIDYVQVNGDSGNDAELLEVPGVVGCVVSNAHPELKAAAQKLIARGTSNNIHMAANPCAGGILETMVQHNIIPSRSPILQCYVPGILALPGVTGASGGTGRCCRSSSLHDASTNAIPAQTECAPPGGTSIGPDGHAVQPDADAVREAARNVAGSTLDNAPCGPGDTGLQYATTSSCVNAEGAPLDPADYNTLIERTPGITAIGGLTAMEGLHEFVWRLGKALLPELASNSTLGNNSTPVHIHVHSPLRLFITNDCTWVCGVVGGTKAPAGQGLQQAGNVVALPQHAGVAGRAGGEQGLVGVASPDGEPWLHTRVCDTDPDLMIQEISHNLAAQGVADAAAEDANSAAAWVDQVQVAMKDAAGSQESYEASFKVYMLDAKGCRSSKAWYVTTTAYRPDEPCPHGYLATCIHVLGPLPATLSQLHLPGVDISC